MFHIVLMHPQIPTNTGAIGRLCVNTDTTLHLIEPIGFSLDEKAVRRAGLDYWKFLKLRVWKSFEAFLEANPQQDRFFFATTKTQTPYFEREFKAGDFLFFGSETSGIDESILTTYAAQCMTIPMGKEGRSLNLAISTGIILYEAIKQNFNTYSKDVM